MPVRQAAVSTQARDSFGVGWLATRWNSMGSAGMKTGQPKVRETHPVALMEMTPVLNSSI
ncbi:hypothetical protein CHELA20_50567 [Hyphomicrobiales bacterium]|nr:hypothetical protein CHELA20_50567 [Hyphomicrobiales bacterium]CAH1678603.1 hypothetical protein CHELA41_24560 [Hyphomicrobiales bacterium]